MEMVVGTVTQKTSQKGKPYLLVKPQGSDKAYWVWQHLEEAKKLLSAGARVKVAVEDGEGEYPKIIQIEPMAAVSAVPVPPESPGSSGLSRDLSVLTAYLKDLRVVGKSRAEALAAVRESLEDARALLSNDPQIAARRSVLEWGPRLGVNPESEAWKKYLQGRFPDGKVDWYAALFDLQGVQDGGKVVRVAPSGAYEFVDVPPVDA